MPFVVPFRSKEGAGAFSGERLRTLPLLCFARLIRKPLRAKSSKGVGGKEVKSYTAF